MVRHSQIQLVSSSGETCEDNSCTNAAVENLEQQELAEPWMQAILTSEGFTAFQGRSGDGRRNGWDFGAFFLQPKKERHRVQALPTSPTLYRT